MNIHDPRWLSTVGLACDIVGAWLVAWEVAHQFKEKRISEILATATKPTPEYEAYETSKFRMMWAGLAFLTVGFVLQIVAVWIQ